VKLIAGDFLDVEVDGGGSGSFGIGSHLEFFAGGLLELREHKGRRGEGEKKGQVAHKSRKPHETILGLQTNRGL
jgi:hypothetical protein